MPTYDELLHLALSFVKNLLWPAQSKKYDLVFFKINLPSSAIPFMDTKIADLIEKTAKLLPSFNMEGINDDFKKSVLIGMYCYVEVYYHSVNTVIFYQSLFTQIHEDIGELSLEERKAAIKDLQYFCGLIARSPRGSEAQELWNAMPLDMQVVLEKCLNDTDNEISPFWSTVDNLSLKVKDGLKIIYK